MMLRSYEHRTYVRAVEFTDENGLEIVEWLRSLGCDAALRRQPMLGFILDINCENWEFASHARPGTVIIHDPYAYGTEQFTYAAKDDFEIEFKEVAG